jgi:hypothetical protein
MLHGDQLLKGYLCGVGRPGLFSRQLVEVNLPMGYKARNNGS